MDQPVYMRIRNYLLTNNFKFYKVADMSGIKRNDFYKMMTGRKIVGADDVLRIATAVNVRCTDFFQ